MAPRRQARGSDRRRPPSCRMRRGSQDSAGYAAHTQTIQRHLANVICPFGAGSCRTGVTPRKDRQKGGTPTWSLSEWLDRVRQLIELIQASAAAPAAEGQPTNPPAGACGTKYSNLMRFLELNRSAPVPVRLDDASQFHRERPHADPGAGLRLLIASACKVERGLPNAPRSAPQPLRLAARS